MYHCVTYWLITLPATTTSRSGLGVVIVGSRCSTPLIGLLLLLLFLFLLLLLLLLLHIMRLLHYQIKIHSFILLAQRSWSGNRWWQVLNLFN